MASVFGILALVAAVVAVVFMLRSGAADQARLQAQQRAEEVEKKLDYAQEELKGLKDDLKRKANQLEEARERANKAKKKEAKAEKSDQKSDVAAAPAAAQPDPATMARFAAAVEAAERRAAAAEKDLQAKVDAARAEGRRDSEHQVEELKKRLARMEAEREENARKAAEEEQRPTVPGSRIDLSKLDKAVVDELRRYYKRAVNAEKLHALADGQLELAQDKLAETRVRYTAVCRELALAAVNKEKPAEVTDVEAERLANEMVMASDEAARRRANLRGERRPRGERPARPAQGATEAAAPPEANGGERRERGPRPDRPRRERKPAGGAPASGESAAPADVVAKPGAAPAAKAEPDVAVVAAAAAAAAAAPNADEVAPTPTPVPAQG